MRALVASMGIKTGEAVARAEVYLFVIDPISTDSKSCLPPGRLDIFFELTKIGQPENLRGDTLIPTFPWLGDLL